MGQPAAEQPSFFDATTVQPGQAVECKLEPAAEAARSAASSEHRTAAAAGGERSPLFQYYGHCCDERIDEEFSAPVDRVYGPEDLGQSVGREYRVRPCRCRKWFCAGCGPRLGYKLRQRLLPRLRTFTAVYGVTLTVDGSLFPGPEQAWLYVMENRLLSRLIRDLEQRGYLHSKAYFWVVEFQHQTEQPHWHMLLDAKFVPYGEIVEIWSRFRPATAPKLEQAITAENYQGQAPAFGSVRFTPATDREKAGYYATKYLTKYPVDGYPAWVLDRVGRMPRYNHSKGFFPRESKHDPMCFCDECRGDAPIPPNSSSPKKKERKNPSRKKAIAATIRQRLEQCGNRCTIVQVERIQLSDGTLVDGKARFNGQLNLSFQEACDYLGLSLDRWQIELSGPEATALEELAQQRQDAGRAA